MASSSLTLQQQDEGLVLTGALDLAHARHLATALDQLAINRLPEPCTIDLAGVQRIDGAGIVLLMRFMEQVEAAGREVRLGGDNRRAEELLDLYRQRRADPPPPASRPGFLYRVGATAAGLQGELRHVLSTIGLYAWTSLAALRRPNSICWRDVPLLVQRAGADGMLIVVLTNVLVGAIMGFQGVVQLARFGAESFTPTMVAMGHLREMGPIMTAIIVAGRSGAGFAAELGTMKVSEEVDALRTMGFDPLRWLMFPRVIALLIALPLLTLLGDVMGILGGALASLPFMDIGWYGYLEATSEAAEFRHFAIGMSKSFVFAIAIGWLACSQGLAARGGAAAVGVRTTSAVVLSIFAVVVLDAFFALLTTAMDI